MSDPIGIAFGRYRLVETLGIGGMAIVHRATIDGPRGFAKTVVVKRVLAEYSHDPTFVSMLVSEARLSAMLRHPAIVQIHDFGEHAGEYFLAMEYIEGHDLIAVLKGCARARKYLPAGLVCHLISEVAGALAYAHALTDEQDRPLDIVHRDISPSNIMVTRQGGVKLLDFGIARAAEYVRDERTRTGTLKGKISYMAPEQADGLAVDRRADIFSLGVVFHECLTLARLFKGENDLSTLRLIREANVRPPSQLLSTIAPDIDAVVLRMLARRSEDRFQSCDEVVAALAPIIHRLHGDAPGLKRFLQEVPPPRQTSPSLSGIGPGRTGPPAPVLPVTQAMAPRAPAFTGDAVQTTLTRSTGEMAQLSDVSLRGRPWLRSPALWLAATTLLTIVLIFALRGESANGPLTPAVSPNVAPPVAATPPPVVTPLAVEAKRPARVHVAGTAGAEILVDGRVVGNVPADLQLAGDATAHELVVQRAGYTRFTRTIALASDTDLSLDARLQRIAAAPSRRPSPPPPTRKLNTGVKLADPFAE